MAGTLAIGTVYVPETAAELRDDFLADLRLEARKASSVEPAVQPGTDDYRFATAVANAGMLQYANIAASRDAVTPLNATGDDLDHWREALGLPVVQPSPSTGKLVIAVDGGGSVTIPDGQQFVLPNGLRGRVSGTWVGVADKAEIDVVTIDAGDAANLDAGQTVRFVAPPLNVRIEAKVSPNGPLRGGYDAETDDRKRVRVLNAAAYKPAGGNWAQLRQIALDNLASVANCYVYPALGGPASCKVVPVRDYDVEAGEFTRAMNSAAIALVQAALWDATPSQDEIVVQASADESVDVSLLLTIPDSSLAGGNGAGWTDAAPWPPLVGSDSGRVAVTAATSSTQITVGAHTTTAPVAGQTHVAWWSPNDRRFRAALVTAVSGSSGAWALTLDVPLVDSDGAAAAVGDFVSPAAANIVAYGATWVEIMRKLGPGENTSDANRLPRAKRHPYTSDESPSSLNLLALRSLVDAHAEIEDGDWSYRSATEPTVPVSVADAPNVLVPRHFGVYAQ